MNRVVSVLLGVFLFYGCSVSDYNSLINAAKTKNIDTIKNVAINKGVGYAKNPAAIKNDIASIEGDFLKILSIFLGDVTKVWGKKETQEPTTKKYVKYTDNYKSRAIVDFESGLVTVETTDIQNNDAALKKALVVTMLTPEDPSKVDLYSSKEIELKGEPYLAGLIKDNQDTVVLYSWRANRYAEYLVNNNKKTRYSDGKQIDYVTFNLVKDFELKSSNKYAGIVKLYAKKYGLEESLVYAIIKTESNFNPYAVSHIPAYGLMQIVPSSAGRDAHRALEGKDGMPSKEVLFDPKNNIKYGTTYLNILFDKYLAGIKNKQSQEYCVISAYNTGASNVLRTFNKDKNKALDTINRLDSNSVYWKLKTALPYAETRRYIQKVTEAKKQFIRG